MRMHPYMFMLDNDDSFPNLLIRHLPFRHLFHGLYIVFTLLPSDISQKFFLFNSSISCFVKMEKLTLFYPVSVDLPHLAVHFKRHRSTGAGKNYLALQVLLHVQLLVLS